MRASKQRPRKLYPLRLKHRPSETGRLPVAGCGQRTRVNHARLNACTQRLRSLVGTEMCRSRDGDENACCSRRGRNSARAAAMDPGRASHATGHAEATPVPRSQIIARRYATRVPRITDIRFASTIRCVLIGHRAIIAVRVVGFVARVAV